MITLPGLPKLILLIGIIVLVWYGFRFLGQVDRVRRRAASEAAARSAAAAHRTRQQTGQGSGLPKVEDMVKCRVCGSYVPARNPSRCGRNDCPY